MSTNMTSSRATWIACGLVAGLAIAYFCPHVPTYATTADRDSQFMMVTVPVGNKAVGIEDPIDGVFIVDFLTGQLKGAVLNRQLGKFTSFYMRDLAGDFGVKGDDEPHYCIVSGYSQMPAIQGATFASGVLFVGELNTGKVAAYSFPWNEAGTNGPQELIFIHSFPFKQPQKK
ncbi:MAG: hypothetical protein JSS02_34095 [Planctomycetes bacterium]|nr:hypothetical protein [Planctomycetota bacterium]